uniref:Membrane protein n=1 Tax=uncultured Elusimicrobia bacterium TaxID=699876 RepID=A0A650ENC5_9BACT|nr:membrane protein [uncultured Elusimicrobia bacterium]
MKKILLLLALLAGAGLSFAQNAPVEKVAVVYFGSPYCGHCQHFEREFLDGFLERNKDRMEFVKVDVTQDNLSFMAALKEYGAEFPGTPAMAVGDEFLMGYPHQIGSQADKAVEKAFLSGVKTRVKVGLPVKRPAEKTKSVKIAVQKSAPKTPAEANAQPAEPVFTGTQETEVPSHESVFKQLTFWMIAGAGLIDGINPCAFAVIVFFISFLSVYKYTRREMVVVGTAYCLAVFLAYVLLGLGAFKFLYAMQGFYYVMWAVKAGTVLLCAGFFAACVYDFIHYYRTKDASGLVLQLPAKYKTFIHKVMHVFLKDRSKSVWRLGAAAVAVGFIVSLVEAVCTGQVYLPTIVVVLKEANGHFLRAMGYLLFYNLMFIVPLVGVFVLALAGYESKTFGGWLKKHLGLTKILMCLVFAALLLVLIKTW